MRFADPKNEGKINYYNFIDLTSDFSKKKRKKKKSKK